MKTVIIRIIHFNDIKTFSEAFQNTNFHNSFKIEFVFGICIIRLPSFKENVTPSR